MHKLGYGSTDNSLLLADANLDDWAFQAWFCPRVFAFVSNVGCAAVALVNTYFSLDTQFSLFLIHASTQIDTFEFQVPTHLQ